MRSIFGGAAGSARAAAIAFFVLAGLSFSAWAVRIPDLKRALALDEATLGLVLLGTAAGSVVAMSASGWTIARFGSRRVTTVAGLLVCALLPLPPLAPSAPLLFGALALFGAAYELTNLDARQRQKGKQRSHRGSGNNDDGAPEDGDTGPGGNERRTLRISIEM